MANRTTEFVFVCSSNFWRYLFLCLRTLFASGTRVEHVTVYMTGAESQIRKLRNKIPEPRVSICPVSDNGNGLWYANKCHLCASGADRVVYLDTDVAVLQPIEQLWDGHNEDLLARPADVTYTPLWHPEKWSAALAAAGAPEYPFYSPGFMIFQNGSHQRLGETWMRLTRLILSRGLPLPANRFAEMYAFSIAASLERLTHCPMPDRAHRYAFLGEKPDDAIVYHLGTPGFYRHFLPIERERGWDRRRDLGIPRPWFCRGHALYRRVQYHLKNWLIAPRSKRLND